jgi:hypothetical protein
LRSTVLHQAHKRRVTRAQSALVVTFQGEDVRRPARRAVDRSANAGNWLATVPGKGYFAILRLYGPTEPALDKKWKPGDIEKVK